MRDARRTSPPHPTPPVLLAAGTREPEPSGRQNAADRICSLPASSSSILLLRLLSFSASSQPRESRTSIQATNIQLQNIDGGCSRAYRNEVTTVSSVFALISDPFATEAVHDQGTKPRSGYFFKTLRKEVLCDQQNHLANLSKKSWTVYEIVCCGSA